MLLRDGNNISLEDISDTVDLSKVTYGFSFSAIGYENAQNNPFSYMSKHDMYFYAYIPDLNAYTVIEHMEKCDEVRSEVDYEIAVNGKKYYDFALMIQKRDEIKLQIGSCFNVIEYKDGTGKYNIKICGTLNERILGAEFLLDMILTKSFMIDGQLILFSPNEEELVDLDVDWIKEQLKYMKMVRKMLDNLGETQDLECDNLTEKEDKYIEMLVRAIIYNQPIGFKNNENVQQIITLRISNIVLLLYFRKRDDGRYTISNFCDMELECSAGKRDGELFPTSQYTIMKEEDFCKVSNYNFENARKSLFKWENVVHIDRVNGYLLELIKAYDSSENIVFLNEAEKIANWLCDKNTSDMCMVNLLQIYKRKGELSSECIDKLIELEERNRDDLEMIIGINILLENRLVVERKMSSLEVAAKEQFMSYPIYTLWTSLSEK